MSDKLRDEYTPTTDEVMREYRLPHRMVDPQRSGESMAEWLGRCSIESHGIQMESEAAARRWLARERAAAKAATVPSESDVLARDWYEESERQTDKLIAVREWVHENQSHEIYEATDEQPAECTDECAWCALDQILSAPERLPVPVEPDTPERFPQLPHVEAKYWAELVKARRRIAELEAVAAGWEYGVTSAANNHRVWVEDSGPVDDLEDGEQRMRRTKFVPAGPWLPVEPVQVDPQPHDPTQVTEGGTQ